MADPVIDNGPTRHQLWTGAWVLGAASLSGWMFLALHLNDKSGVWDSASAIALAAGVTCSVFSACCAVLVAVKSAEERIRVSQSVPKVTKA
ncbi:MAG: hypothetical protein WAV00_00155 [Nocardioides sp.]